MVKTGIKKYDELPGRMGWNDIDCMRLSFIKHKKEFEKVKKKLDKFSSRSELTRRIKMNRSQYIKELEKLISTRGHFNVSLVDFLLIVSKLENINLGIGEGLNE